MQTFFFDCDEQLATFLKTLINVITNFDQKFIFQEIKNLEEIPVNENNILILTENLPEILKNAKKINPQIITVIFSNLEEETMPMENMENLDHYILYDLTTNFQQHVLLPFEKIYCSNNQGKKNV